MKITYAPTGINNFHNCGPVTIVISGEKGISALGDGGEYFTISKGQAAKIEKHFCGSRGCQCPKGGAFVLDVDCDMNPTAFGLSAKWCEAI